ncbi:MAG: 23S rRNA (adenine(2503)-C(2))-methyltransferase RlmN [Acidobacteria bacterium]|jgi:23S rRNA (adenine2503-C2)-methyltransferase|nr:23S rRNA (adenine(2503)-C(2))-methyltransferase RlmN [Acidobacteriota bacterium]
MPLTVEQGSPLPLLLDFAGLERADLEQAAVGLGLPSFRGRQIFQWIHQRGVSDFAAMTNLPRLLRDTLAKQAAISEPQLDTRQVSSDGTTKFLLKLGDGRRIEAVYIPDTPGQTFCISTQVGCAMACGFCLTGKMGLLRHLTTAEIVGQVRVMARETGLAGTPFNIVLMGMGEPLHNYDATMRALRILTDDKGAALPARRITLSTVGVLPGLQRLATESLMPNLAISLHATTDDQRDALVPVNRKYKLQELMDVCRAFPLRRRARITFEYVLLAEVNDTPDDARRLVHLLAGIQAKVNLLPLNEADGIEYHRPSEARVNAFAKILADRGVTVSVRKSRGRDIRAACGQLLVETPLTH